MGGREGWGNICLEALILSACISKAISGLSNVLAYDPRTCIFYYYFFFKDTALALLLYYLLVL